MNMVVNWTLYITYIIYLWLNFHLELPSCTTDKKLGLDEVVPTLTLDDHDGMKAHLRRR